MYASVVGLGKNYLNVLLSPFFRGCCFHCSQTAKSYLSFKYYLFILSRSAQNIVMHQVCIFLGGA